MAKPPEATRIGIVEPDAPAGASSRQPSGIGVVDLNVRDVDRVAQYYQDTIGMRKLASDDGSVTLGSDRPSLRLFHTPDAKPRAPRQAGLYHAAYLLPSRAALGSFVQFLIDTATPIEGASDHAVSEAIYLHDPEHNGIEVYADRPRDNWPMEDGKLGMGTSPMDVEGVLASAQGAWRGWPDGARVGHIHLQVNDVPAAEAFYARTLGLDLMARYGAQATFLSAGGYHHHVAANAWGTQGGPAADPTALGLRAYELLVPAPGYEALVKALGGTEARDPSGNVVRIVRP